MSLVLTRSPLEQIGMNGGGIVKRRSARLSQEGDRENEPPTKKTKVNGASTTTAVSTKQQDGDNSKGAGRRKRKVYDEEVEGFTFSKGRRGRGKEINEPPARNSADGPVEAEHVVPAPPPDAPARSPTPANAPPAPVEEAAPKTTQKKTRRRLPTTPDRDASERPTRRSQRLSNEKAEGKASEPSPQRPSHAQSHANVDSRGSPSPGRARPVTVEKKRKHGANAVEEERIMTIALPFADTPIIRRNKEMRKNSAEGHRRSSAGMRGRRASSMIDEGRGHEASKDSQILLLQTTYGNDNKGTLRAHTAPPGDSEYSTLSADVSTTAQALHADNDISTLALPHSEVSASEFFKHISAELTEPRRMRLLLGWCGTRCLPSKPEAPQQSAPAANLEFQAAQAARIIQEELSQELIANGTLSDWFSRDDTAQPQVPLRKKANPRNISNAAKAEELERELDRLKKERAEWDELMQSAVSTSSPQDKMEDPDSQLSPLRPELLESSQRAIFEQLKSTTKDASTEPSAVQQRLRTISDDLEFAIDQFAHGIRVLTTTRDTAERIAERSLADAAHALEDREKQQTAASGKPADQMNALRGLARVLNDQYR